MARKSRRTNLPQPVKTPIKVEETSDVLATGAYARLSVEKDDEGSIQTQVSLLHNYIAEHPELRLADTYIDNGYSGTDFDRPSFTRLMDDVRTGKIQCIVVKDLSRFGRDFLETGYYIETLLPKLNVRLIAINDTFDSSREEDVNSISVPIKNMVNEMYAKDFSRKVSAYHDLHRKKGDVHLTRTVYGYQIDKENNVYVPNPDTAPVVKMIFRWFLMGYQTGQIAERLNTLEVMTPLKYKETVENGQAFDKQDFWNMARVRDILKNEKYIGDLIWGKRTKRLYLNIPEHKTPQEEWTIYHDMHEPLVTKEDFETARTMIDATTAKLRKKTIYETGDTDSFQGKIYCADCGKRMRYQKLCYQNRNGAIYYCGNDQKEGWHQYVHADFLKLFAADQIRFLIQSMCDRKILIEKAKRRLDGRNKLYAAKRKTLDLQQRLDKVGEHIASLYEDLAEGVISQEEYKELQTHYAKERTSLQDRITEAEQEQRNVEMQIGRFLDWQAKLEQHLGEVKFNENLANDLIERIEVSDQGRIEIHFTCDDVCRKVAELLEDGDNS